MSPTVFFFICFLKSVVFFHKRQGWMVGLTGCSYCEVTLLSSALLISENTIWFLSLRSISHILSVFFSFLPSTGTRAEGCCWQCPVWGPEETSRHKEDDGHPAWVGKASETEERSCCQERFIIRLIQTFLIATRWGCPVLTSQVQIQKAVSSLCF